MGRPPCGHYTPTARLLPGGGAWYNKGRAYYPDRSEKRPHMGFLDRLKASFSQATGGKATLHLELSPAAVAPGGQIDYRLVLTTSGPLKAEGITITLHGRERVRVWMGSVPVASAAPGG